MNSTILAFISGLGWGEVVLILAVVLLLFGAKKLPELARGLGQGIKEFKKATHDVQQDIQRAIEEEPAPPPAPRHAAEKPVPSETASGPSTPA
ncbi:MAG: twin-arginine translocase TatA/TatE family subunit [Verrucomicrobiales bacterium]|nr:twin-arginine translocase TatA/TatE family subunit [Verrucomicrobiales bacterium]